MLFPPRPVPSYLLPCTGAYHSSGVNGVIFRFSSWSEILSLICRELEGRAIRRYRSLLFSGEILLYVNVSCLLFVLQQTGSVRLYVLVCAVSWLFLSFARCGFLCYPWYS